MMVEGGGKRLGYVSGHSMKKRRRSPIDSLQCNSRSIEAQNLGSELCLESRRVNDFADLVNEVDGGFHTSPGREPVWGKYLRLLHRTTGPQFL